MPHSGYITARDQSMFKSGVTEGGKILPVFFFVNEDNNTNTKPQAKKQRSYPRREAAANGGKDAGNIRKVLCESLLQWF